MRTESFAAADGTRLQLYWWDGCDKPVGAVKIIHGMCEHMARYDAFDRALKTFFYHLKTPSVAAAGVEEIYRRYILENQVWI